MLLPSDGCTTEPPRRKRKRWLVEQTYEDRSDVDLSVPSLWSQLRKVESSYGELRDRMSSHLRAAGRKRSDQGLKRLPSQGSMTRTASGNKKPALLPHLNNVAPPSPALTSPAAGSTTPGASKRKAQIVTPGVRIVQQPLERDNQVLEHYRGQQQQQDQQKQQQEEDADNAPVHRITSGDHTVEREAGEEYTYAQCNHASTEQWYDEHKATALKGQMEGAANGGEESSEDTGDEAFLRRHEPLERQERERLQEPTGPSQQTRNQRHGGQSSEALTPTSSQAALQYRHELQQQQQQQIMQAQHDAANRPPEQEDGMQNNSRDKKSYLVVIRRA